MISKRAITGLVAALAISIACGGREPSATPSELQGQGEAVLTVTNDYLNDVTVYAVRAGTRARLGTVFGFKTETLPIRNTILFGAGSVRLLIEENATGRRHLTEPFTVGPNDAIDVTVRSPLSLSSFIVRHR